MIVCYESQGLWLVAYLPNDVRRWFSGSRWNLPRVYEWFGVDVPDWLSAGEGRRYRAETLHHLLPLAVLQRLHSHPDA